MRRILSSIPNSLKDNPSEKLVSSQAYKENHSQGVHVNREMFQQLMEESAMDKELFCEIRDDMLMERSNTSYKRKCTICNQENHDVSNCNELHYVADKEREILRATHSSFQKRRFISKGHAHLRVNAWGDLYQIQVRATEIEGKSSLYNKCMNDQIDTSISLNFEQEIVDESDQYAISDYSPEIKDIKANQEKIIDLGSPDTIQIPEDHQNKLCSPQSSGHIEVDNHEKESIFKRKSESMSFRHLNTKKSSLIKEEDIDATESPKSIQNISVLGKRIRYPTWDLEGANESFPCLTNVQTKKSAVSTHSNNSIRSGRNNSCTTQKTINNISVNPFYENSNANLQKNAHDPLSSQSQNRKCSTPKRSGTPSQRNIQKDDLQQDNSQCLTSQQFIKDSCSFEQFLPHTGNQVGYEKCQSSKNINAHQFCKSDIITELNQQVNSQFYQAKTTSKGDTESFSSQKNNKGTSSIRKSLRIMEEQRANHQRNSPKKSIRSHSTIQHTPSMISNMNMFKLEPEESNYFPKQSSKISPDSKKQSTFSRQIQKGKKDMRLVCSANNLESSQQSLNPQTIFFGSNFHQTQGNHSHFSYDKLTYSQDLQSDQFDLTISQPNEKEIEKEKALTMNEQKIELQLPKLSQFIRRTPHKQDPSANKKTSPPFINQISGRLHTLLAFKKISQDSYEISSGFNCYPFEPQFSQIPVRLSVNLDLPLINSLESLCEFKFYKPHNNASVVLRRLSHLSKNNKQIKNINTNHPIPQTKALQSNNVFKQILQNP